MPMDHARRSSSDSDHQNAPPPLARAQGGVGTQVVVPGASTHSGEVGAQSGAAGTGGTLSLSLAPSLTQGGRADTQGRRAVPTGAVPRARTQGGVGTQVVVPRASTHSSEVGAQSGGAGTQGGRAAPMEVPNTPPCFARARRGRTNVCMFSLRVLGPSMSFGLWPMWYYRGGLSPSKRPPRSLRSPPVSMPSGHGRSSTSST